MILNVLGKIHEGCFRTGCIARSCRRLPKLALLLLQRLLLLLLLLLLLILLLPTNTTTTTTTTTATTTTTTTTTTTYYYYAFDAKWNTQPTLQSQTSQQTSHPCPGRNWSLHDASESSSNTHPAGMYDLTVTINACKGRLALGGSNVQTDG
jgi:hypothetical protein